MFYVRQGKARAKAPIRKQPKVFLRANGNKIFPSFRSLLSVLANRLHEERVRRAILSHTFGSLQRGEDFFCTSKQTR